MSCVTITTFIRNVNLKKLTQLSSMLLYRNNFGKNRAREKLSLWKYSLETVVDYKFKFV